MKQQRYQARIMTNIGQRDEMNLRFVDGLVYESGVDGLILQVSSGHAFIGHQHACDDTLKIVHSLMCILKDDAQANANASFASYQRIKVFGIQTIKTTIILSEMYLDDEMKYKYNKFPSKITNRSNGFR